MTVTADEDLTEFELIEVESIKGVPAGANGFPHLIMKGLSASGTGAGATADTPRPFPDGSGKVQSAHMDWTGRHLHEHHSHSGPDGNSDGLHQHWHEHTSDNDHDHDHAHTAAAPDDSAKSALVEAVKAVVRGKVDEGPDVDLGKQIMALLGQAIGNEAQEIAAGFHGEICDVSLLSQAAELVKCWTQGEQTAPIDGASTKAAMSSAGQNDLPDSAFAYIEDGGSKDSSGKTTPRSLRHFPVHDKAHAQNALARLSSSPFGDKAKAKVHAAAKKFGIDVSDDSSSKSMVVAEGGTTVDTDAQGTGALTKSYLEAAITKAIGPLKAENATLRADLAKVLATPIPGGPVLSAAARPMGGAHSAESEDLAAKAALYRAKADACVSPGDREGYRQLAREMDDKAAKLTPAVASG